jgi:O-antigen ligase
VLPLLIFITATPYTGSTISDQLQNIMAPRPENKIVWPLLAAIAGLLVVRNWSRLTFPPHIVSLLAYLAFAGATALWSIKPETSLWRFVLQAAILASIVFPTMLAGRTADVFRGLFLCLALTCILNIFIVLNQNPVMLDGEIFGYQGYFSDKNTLGTYAALALLLSLHEILYSGRRRVFGIVVAGIAIALVIFSKSKTGLGLAIAAPILAGLALIASRVMRISPAIVLLPIPMCYWILSIVWGNIVNRISWHVYGNYDLSGRTYIWDFVNYEIARRPFLGWGYQSFWLVGPDGPSMTDGSGWIRVMPHAHNGYLDTMLEMGYVGLALLIFFIIATIRAIGRVTERDFRRAWLLLSLALFAILSNFLESRWMRGSDVVWLMFVFVAAESAQYWERSRLRRAQRGHRRFIRRPVITGRPPEAATAAARR